MIPLTLVLLGMTVVVVLLLLLPLLHRWRAPAARRQFDRAVYRAQLDELERDVARGVIGGAEAQAARLEIERRLLAAATAPGGAQDAATARVGSSRALALATALIIAGGAGLVYLGLGAPGVPDEPFAARQEATPVTPSPHVDMAAAARALAAKLQTDPNNAQGWLLYARTESMLGNWQTSVAAYQHAMALGQNGPDVQAGYGEMLVLAASGIVGPPARAALTSALQQDAKNQVARYYVALADAQAGDSKRAIAGWQALAGDLPEDSPMREAIGQQVADAASAAGIAAPPLPKGQPAAAPATATAAAPAGAATANGPASATAAATAAAPAGTGPAGAGSGPASTQMAAAENMPPAERDQMVRGMVDKLAAQLAGAPDDPDGWMRLGRAYTVLGEADKAVDAYDHAAKLKPGDVEIPLQEVEAMLTNRKPDDVIPARVVALLKQVQAVSPDRPEVLWYLGVVAARNGQREDAKRDWQRLLPLLPAESENHKTVAEALRMLDNP